MVEWNGVGGVEWLFWECRCGVLPNRLLNDASRKGDRFRNQIEIGLQLAVPGLKMKSALAELRVGSLMS